MIHRPHVIKIEGHLYPCPHRRWGGCADELLHHRSRYYHYAEAFLRNLTGQRDFMLGGYRAEALSDCQRRVMAALLSRPPGSETGGDAIRLVGAVQNGDSGVDADLADRYGPQLEVVPREEQVVLLQGLHPAVPPADLPPLEPFLAVAERLRLPVVVDGGFVELSLGRLAGLLDAPQPQVRANMQNALLWLHEAGYRLRDKPGLSHREARRHGALERH